MHGVDNVNLRCVRESAVYLLTYKDFASLAAIEWIETFGNSRWMYVLK